MGQLLCSASKNNEVAQEQASDDVILETFRKEFKGTVYFSALMMEEDEQDDESFHYAPAAGANTHGRSAILLEQKSTMLSKHDLLLEKNHKLTSAAVLQELKDPSNKSQHVVEQGYPGELTVPELDACVQFRKRVKEMKDPAYYDMVRSLAPAEEEPYAICRFLRARSFDVDAAITMMTETGALQNWKQAAQHNFYPTAEGAIGCSEATFYTQCPTLRCGLARNGTVVVYLRGGSLCVEGFECLTNLSALHAFAWYATKSRLVGYFEMMQQKNPESVVRCELTYIIDLKNLTASQVSTKMIDTMKNMFAACPCFPEILNKIIIVNAPSFFSFVWRMIKVFLHPRTAKKVEIISNNGAKRLTELIRPENVLSDYGGKAPSFDDLADQSYCGEGCRQVHRLFSIPKMRKSEEWKVQLKAKEEATITVYTRSSLGAVFTVSSSSTNRTSKKGVVQSHVVSNSASKEGPYSKVIASKLEGAGDVKVTAKSKSNQPAYFVVIASISQKK